MIVSWQNIDESVIWMNHSGEGARPPYFDVAIFDLDGTLTESEPGIVKSVKYSLDSMGRTDYDAALLRSFIGPPLYESYTQTMGMDEAAAREGVRLFRAYFERHGWMDNAVYTGVPQMLRSLKKHGVYLAVASAKPEKFCRKILNHFGLLGFFDQVIAARPEDEHSRKPEQIRRALPERYARACMVGDRKFDVEGARANGIEAVGVLYGYGGREELESSGADTVVETVDQLTDYLLGGRERARGPFITLEGPDGCGKSTQAPFLAKWLEKCGYRVTLTREPGGCPVAERVRALLLDVKNAGMTDLCEALLFAAARAQHVSDVIAPALASGRAVLCDRFVDSSVAYQGAGRALGTDLVKSINAPAVRECKIDLTLLLLLEPEKGLEGVLSGGAPDRIEQSDLEFARRTYNYYLEMAARESGRVNTVNALGTVEEVRERLRERLTSRLAQLIAE